ncbi:hypothetical protein [uncultured Kordia sp.]|uniref:hypothetical protein n=1 Tax=uncultured Kordia sp. TaxID=507699 RepID=UPI00260AC621|nr:hypothetical protein [uncultured Kordia sp.]
MAIIKKLCLLFIGFLCINCARPQKAKEKQPIKIENTFDVEAVKWFKTPGNGTIKGVAKFKSKNGETRFGEKFRIELMPDCLYTQERLHHIYKNTNAGYVHVENGIPTFTPDPKEYHDTKKTMCNEKGEFEFTNLPAGDYYIIAFMLWDKTGGGIMQYVQLKEGETQNIEMLNF